jgi:hypothetical protein
MNDLKPAAGYLSPIAIVVALGLTFYMLATQTFTLPLGLLALMLGLTALWLQNIAK